MKISFSKFQGTGNDFIIIDNRKKEITLSSDQILMMCDRRFGIGADGLMLLENEAGYDFKMAYYNSDGNTSSMCGNGGRCITRFAEALGIVKEKAYFIAIDGSHDAILNDRTIKLKMNNVDGIEKIGNDFFLGTGSPHYVSMVGNIESFPVYVEGKKIRNSERFKKEGTNVNFIEKNEDALFVRTFERGVEDETLSCGTGVTAAALVAASNNMSTGNTSCKINTIGGKLTVHFNKKENGSFENIWLEGPAALSFEGTIEI